MQSDELQQQACLNTLTTRVSSARPANSLGTVSLRSCLWGHISGRSSKTKFAFNRRVTLPTATSFDLTVSTACTSADITSQLYVLLYVLEQMCFKYDILHGWSDKDSRMQKMRPASWAIQGPAGIAVYTSKAHMSRLIYLWHIIGFRKTQLVSWSAHTHHCWYAAPRLSDANKHYDYIKCFDAKCIHMVNGNAWHWSLMIVVSHQFVPLHRSP